MLNIADQYCLHYAVCCNEWLWLCAWISGMQPWWGLLFLFLPSHPNQLCTPPLQPPIHLVWGAGCCGWGHTLWSAEIMCATAVPLSWWAWRHLVPLFLVHNDIFQPLWVSLKLSDCCWLFVTVVMHWQLSWQQVAYSCHMRHQQQCFVSCLLCCLIPQFELQWWL